MNYKSLIGPAIILLLGTVVFVWFKGSPFLFGSDTGFPLDLKTVNEYFYILPFNSAFGGPDVAKFTVLSPIGLLLKAYSFTGLSYSAPIFERLWVYITFSSSGLSMFFFLSVLFPDKRYFARLFGSLVYMFNFFIMWLWIDLPFLTIAYAFFPVIFALFIKGVEEQRGALYACLLSLLWTILLSSGYGLPWAATNWIAVLSFVFFYLLVYRNKDRIKKAVLFTVCVLGSWIAINAFWLFPLSKSFAGELTRNALPGVNVSGLFASNSVSVLDAVRFLGPPDYLLASYKGSLLFPWFNIYSSPEIIVLSFLVPLLVILGLFKPRNKHLIFFALFTFLFLFLVKGPNPPFGEINSFLFSQQGFDFMFRSVYQRFMGYVVLGSVVLITFSVDWALNLRIRRQMVRIGRGILLVALAVSLVVILPSPIWTGDIYNQSGVFSSRRVTIPDYYSELSHWVDAQDGQFNVLPLPYPTAFKGAFLWGNGSEGYYSKYPFAFTSAKSFIINDFGNQTGSSFVRLLISGSFNDSSVLNLFNIKYVFLHHDANWQYIEGNPGWVSGSIEQMENSLKSLDGLVLEKSFEAIDVYRNTKWQPSEAYLLSQDSFNNTVLHSDDIVLLNNSSDLSAWSSVTGQWIVSTKLGTTVLEGTNSSSLSLDIDSARALRVEGMFSFGQLNAAHYPFVLTTEEGLTFYPIVANDTGFFVTGIGSNEVYNISRFFPDVWYNITVSIDSAQNRFWLWINSTSVNEEGLPIYSYQTHSKFSSPIFTQVTIFSGDSMEDSSSVISDVKISNQYTEDLIESYTSAAELVKNATSVDLQKISSVEYQGNLSWNEPSVLILNENYDPNWLLTINGAESRPAVGMGFANSYLIEGIGTQEITLYYSQQNWFYIGSIISIIIISIIVGYLLLKRRTQLLRIVRPKKSSNNISN